MYRTIEDGSLFLDPAVYAADFAGDLSKADAQSMALSQMPVTGKSFGRPINGAGLERPAQYAILATDDRMIHLELQRWMYQRAKAHVTEVKSSHVVFLSPPHFVAKVIAQAAQHAR